MYLQTRRDAKAAKSFFQRFLKSGGVPKEIVTDKLRSYGVAHRSLISSTRHNTQRYANNRAELSHQPTRIRERIMRQFSSDGENPMTSLQIPATTVVAREYNYCVVSQTFPNQFFFDSANAPVLISSPSRSSGVRKWTCSQLWTNQAAAAPVVDRNGLCGSLRRARSPHHALPRRGRVPGNWQRIGTTVGTQ